MVASLTDLPPNILAEILSRLPIKTLFSCKCSCKTFLNLTSSNPHFKTLHSSRASQNLIIQYKIRRLLYVIDPQRDITSGFRINLPNRPIVEVPTTIFPPARRNCKNNNFVIVNACNGLIFIAHVTGKFRYLVCNPVTNEYFPVPEVDDERGKRDEPSRSWLGFSPRSNDYKIVSFSGETNPDTGKDALLYVIGSNSWKYVEGNALPRKYLRFPTFLNGKIYWLTRFRTQFISLFDFDDEKFGEIEFPLDFLNDHKGSSLNMSIGVLEGCLCVNCNTDLHFDIWFMKMDDDQVSWSKGFSFFGESSIGPFTPLLMLGGGEILMVRTNCLFCYDPKTKSFRALRGYFNENGTVVFTPCLISLKDLLRKDNVIVQEIRPRDEEPTYRKRKNTV